MPNLDLSILVLAKGAHANPEEGMCVMEAAAYIAGQTHSDHPECVCPTIGEFLRTWNHTSSEEERQELKPFVLRILGTNGGDELALRRSYAVADWYARVFLPAWLRCANVAIERADALSTLPECVDPESLHRTDEHINVARAAAGAAARDAAGDAAVAAAWDAAWDAAWERLKPTRDALRASAFDLLDRLIAMEVG